MVLLLLLVCVKEVEGDEEKALVGVENEEITGSLRERGA